MIVKPGSAYSSDVLSLYLRGLPPGSSTGWMGLDPFYSVAGGQLSVITGIPNHGKSAWLDALTINLLHYPYLGKPWKFLVCSPEQEPCQLHISELLERQIGKRFRDGAGSRMSQQDIRTALGDVIGDRYEFASFEDDDNFGDLLGVAREFAERASGSWTPGIILDPWNRLEHRRPSHFSETEYISEALSLLVTLVRTTGAHMWVVAHPQKLLPDRQTGKRPVPGPYDISGSAHWANKADNVLAVWRDMDAAREGLPSQFETHVFVQKIRWKHIGRVGEAVLRYDPATGRYADMDDGGYRRARA